MKKWIIVLVITNVITLLGFSITLTVLIMKNYLEVVRSAETETAENSEADFQILKSKYEQATKQKADAKIPAISEEPKIAPTEEAKETPVIQLTPDEYKKVSFADRWRIVMMSYNPKNPDKSYAPLENILKESKIVTVGTVLETFEVTKMTNKEIYFRSPDGKIININIDDEKIWANYPIPPEKLLNLKNKMNKNYGNADDSADSNDNFNKTVNKTATSENSAEVRDSEGNVIILPKGVSKENLPKDLINNMNNPSKADSGKNTPKDNENYTKKYRFIAPKDVYKILTKFSEIIRQAVLENYYDEEELAFAGVKIVNFDADSYFNKFEFQPGDIIMKINGEKVETRIQLDHEIDSKNFSEGVDIIVKRNDEVIKFEFRFSYQAMLEYAAKLEGLLNDVPENPDFNDDKKDENDKAAEK